MNTHRVLVVDDDDDNREVLRLYLSHKGYEVQGAGDGIAALRMVQEARLSPSPFTHCILDCAMPLMDGVTCAETIRKLEARNHHYTKLRIAFYSAYLDGVPCDEIKARGGADICLEKGSETAQSMEAFARWLASSPNQ